MFVCYIDITAGSYPEYDRAQNQDTALDVMCRSCRKNCYGDVFCLGHYTPHSHGLYHASQEPEVVHLDTQDHHCLCWYCDACVDDLEEDVVEQSGCIVLQENLPSSFYIGDE